MAHIVLSDEQVETLQTALEPVELRDRDGRVIRVIAPAWSKEDITKAKEALASNGPWHTTEQVLKHLQSLEQQ